VLTDTALPATLTAFHVALAMLRRHRAHGSAFSPFVLPSFLFPVFPWLWASTMGLAVVTGAHIIWCAVCEVLAPVPQARAASRPASTPVSRTPSPSRQSASRPAAPKQLSAAVLTVLDETPEIKTFRLARPPDFEFRAGQFVPVRVNVNGQPHVRCYSISSSPEVRGYFEISVRRQGLVSSTLHALLRPGASVSLGKPAGQFVYPAGDDRPIALLAGGVGITPLLSMLRYAVATDPLRPVTLLYSVRTAHDVAFASELQMIAERHPQVHVAITVTDEPSATRWHTGRIDGPLVRRHVAHPAHTIFLMCGPPPMMTALGDALQNMGVAADQVRFEAFDTAIAATLLNQAAAPVPSAPQAASGDTYQLEFAVSGRTATNVPSRSLLEAAEAEGIAIPSSCRAGVCQACRTRVSAGDVDCRSDMLAAEDREAGFILPCVSWAATDCVLEA
jgi:ferredoxin-NADP reductase